MGINSFLDDVMFLQANKKVNITARAKVLNVLFMLTEVEIPLGFYWRFSEFILLWPCLHNSLVLHSIPKIANFHSSKV